MNGTDAPGGSWMPDGQEQIGGLSYGLGVSIGLLLLIATIALASYYCALQSMNSFSPPARRVADEATAAADLEAGLDEATLMSFPKVRYSEEGKGRDEGSACCSICLADYKDKDVLRRLPDCGHQFHLKCVDPWLRLHPTCPVCRTSPLPSPLRTPLAEVVPPSLVVAIN